MSPPVPCGASKVTGPRLGFGRVWFFLALVRAQPRYTADGGEAIASLAAWNKLSLLCPRNGDTD